MRIALVSPYDYSVPGGVNNHISHLASEFTRLGHEARILVPSAEKQIADSRVINASSAIIPIPFAGSIARISLSPRTYRRTKSILQEGRYDVLHLHEPLTVTLPLAVLRHRDLVPQAICVGTFHAYREVSRTYYYGAPIFRRFFKRLDGVIAVSEAARRYHSRYFPANYTVIPNGVDVEHFGQDLRPIEQFADGRPNVLFVGRLERRKGLTYLIDAFALVQRDLPDARLIIVGAYDELGKLPFVLQARHLELANVHFVGRVTDLELARYYHTADVFCAPSTGMESFGMVLLEAMASGVPIVASRIEGYDEVMDDGVQGVFVKPEAPQELAAALLTLLRDPDRRRAMGMQGREKAKRYSWRVVAAQVLDYYAAIREQVPVCTRRTVQAISPAEKTV